MYPVKIKDVCMPDVQQLTKNPRASNWTLTLYTKPGSILAITSWSDTREYRFTTYPPRDSTAQMMDG
jgi:hypothetical protein